MTKNTCRLSLWAVALFLIMLVGPTAALVAADRPATFGTASSALKDAIAQTAALPDLSDDEQQALHRAAGSLKFLINRWKGPGTPDWQPPKVSAMYVASLNNDTDVLKTSRSLDTATRFDAIEFVRKDLREKRLNCANQSSGLGKDVTIFISVMNGSKPVNGEYVYYGYGYAPDLGGQNRSETRTPKARITVSPGVWAFWIKESPSHMQVKGVTADVDFEI
jgi:hypothetical protein